MRGILTTSPAARTTCWTCKQGFTLPLQKNTSLIPAQSAGNGSLVLGVKGWLMRGAGLWSVMGLLMRGRDGAELLEFLPGMIFLLNSHSARQRMGDGSSLLRGRSPGPILHCYCLLDHILRGALESFCSLLYFPAFLLL